MQWAVGALLAAAIAALAYRTRTLTRSGALAAFGVGLLVFGAGGWPAAALLFAFFVPSVLLSRLGRARKRALRDVEKTGARDAWQVLANGGTAALCALLALRFGDVALIGAAGAFAAASADTWGTEIGTLARQPPRSVLTLAPVAPGLSGGITWLGTLATLAGAVVVGLVAWGTRIAPFGPVVLAGFVGAALDSLLGAGLQALRYCPTCRADCETDPHSCGTPTVLRRGYGWLRNDAVNLACTLVGAIVAIATTG